jgi:D-aminopeptidase
MLGREASKPGGFAIAQIEVAGGTVTALVVVNAYGVVMPTDDPRPMFLDAHPTPPSFGQNTTLMAIITDVACGHDVLTRMCVAAHDGLARTIWPSHTIADGDVAFASTVSEGPTDPATILPLTIATELAVEKALRAATIDGQ